MGRIRVKQSKGQSIGGMIGGIVFIGIGLFVAIPTFGAFGVLWTLFAVVITGVNAYNAFSEEGIANYEIDIEENNRNRSYSNNYQEQNYYENITQHETSKETQVDFDEKLRKLKKLRDDEIITEEEFQNKKEQILNEKW